MTDVLTWTIERRVKLAERAELLRKELAEIDVEVARLEAAEVVYGQWAETTDGGRSNGVIVEPEPEPEPEPERVVASSGAGGMLLVPHRAESMTVEALPVDCQRILRAVEESGGQPVMTRRVCGALGMGVQPQQTEPMRGKLKRLAERGWLHRTPSGRYSSP